MAEECAGRREFTELVTDHFFGHLHGNMLLAVIDAEQQADELRQDRRAAAPDLDHVVASSRARLICFLEQIAVDKRTFPNRARHCGRSLLFLLASVTAREDELGGGFVLAGFLALGVLAPGRDRMAAARGAAFAAAMRMVDRVHGHAAIVRTPAEPARAAGFADRGVHLVGVRHRADRADAAAMNEALFAGIQPQDDVFAIAADDLGIGAGGTRDLPALADLHLDIVHDGADRDVRERHRIAGLHVDIFAGHDESPTASRCGARM